MINLTVVNTVSSSGLVFPTCMAERSAAPSRRDSTVAVGMAMGVTVAAGMVMMRVIMAVFDAAGGRRWLVQQLGQAELA